MSGALVTRFDIYSVRGVRIYRSMIRDATGYSWGTSYGFLTDDQIERDKFEVRQISDEENEWRQKENLFPKMA